MGLFSAIAPTLISSGANLLGGLFGKKKRGPSFQDQLDMSRASIFTNMKATMDAARENKIHPLFALGNTPAGGMSFEVGGDEPDNRIGNWMRDTGQDIASALFKRGTKEDRAYAKVTADLAVERGMLENELLKSQIAQIRGAGPAMPSGGEVLPGQADSSGLYPLIKPGIGYGDAAPLHSISIDENGRPMRVFNTNDLGDNEMLQFLHTLRYSVPDYLDQNFTKPGAAALRKFFKRGRR